MYHLHLTRNLRSVAFVLVLLAIISAIGLLLWANHTGMPEPWRTTIEQAISKQGAHVRISAIRYIPLRGVVASEVRVFSDPDHQQEISRLERVILDFDKTKLARGKIHLKKIELRDARLILPVDPEDPDSETLIVTGAHGTLLMPDNRRIEILNARGQIAGIDVVINSQVVIRNQSGGDAGEAQQNGKHRRLAAKIISELNKWHFDSSHPPRVTVFLEGDINKPDSLTADLTLFARGMEKNQHRLDEISAKATFIGNLLSVTELKANDSRGQLTGSVDYNLAARHGRFDLHSTLEIPRLLKAWLGLPPLPDIVIAGSQTLDAEGDFRFSEEHAPEIHLTGHARCESVLLRGMQFDSVESSFSWNDQKLFLKDILLSRPDGYAKGKAMIQLPLVHLALETTFPTAVGIPLFEGKPLEKVLRDFTPREGAGVHVTLEGGFDTRDRKSWVYTGGGKVTHYNYRGVPIDSANCKLSLNSRELDFSDGTVVFNYQNYSLRKTFGGPRQGTVKVGHIHYDAIAKLVHVDNVHGNFWAAPMLRLFAPDTADNLEEYRFHRPPSLQGSGVVDVKKQGRTSLNITFNSESPAVYHFLGKDVTLEAPSGKVAIRDKRVTVTQLNFNAFEAPIQARFDYLGNGKLTGEGSWTKLSTPALASTYDLNMKGDGKVTGRLEFAISDGRVETMSGKGLFALEKPGLLSIPLFGPLSPLVSGVLNNRKVGFESADSAFCNFTIKDGILSTQDFRTSTSSLTFVGDGSVDLRDNTLDMTMRMNARGLLGLLTLPLRPLYGLFQFRGTGPLADPEWNKVLFTPPSAKQKELLQPSPKARIVSEPR